MPEVTAYIDGTPFTYTGITPTSFTGVVLPSGSWNYGDRVSQDLESDTSIYDDTGLLCQLGDRVYKDIRIDDNNLFSQEQLDRLARAYLVEFIKNHSKVVVDVVYSPYIQIGQTVRLTDAYNGVNDLYFIERISETNGLYSLTLAKYPA